MSLEYKTLYEKYPKHESIVNVQFYETEQFSLHSRSLFVTIKIRLHSYMSVLKLDAS